jgi:hypothetical protein
LPLFPLFKVQKATKVSKVKKAFFTFLSSVRLLLKVKKRQKVAGKVPIEAQIKGHFRRKSGVNRNIFTVQNTQRLNYTNQT